MKGRALAVAYAGGDPVNEGDPTGLGLNPCTSGGIWGDIGDFSGVCSAVSAVTTVGQGLWCSAQINGFTGQGCDSGPGQADVLADLENQGIGIYKNTVGQCAFQADCGIAPVAVPYPCENAGPSAFAQLSIFALLGSVPGGDEADALGAGGLAGAGAPEAEATSIGELLEPGGIPIGKAGSDPSIRELTGTLSDAQAVFAQLSTGGKIVEDTANITRVELPDGGFVQLRTVMSERSPNTAATIDINVPGVNITGLKFNP